MAGSSQEIMDPYMGYLISFWLKKAQLILDSDPQLFQLVCLVLHSQHKLIMLHSSPWFIFKLSIHPSIELYPRVAASTSSASTELHPRDCIHEIASISNYLLAQPWLHQMVHASLISKLFNNNQFA